MRAGARVVAAVLMACLAGVLASVALAQDDASCDVYPHLCPPTTTTHTTTTTTTTHTTTSPHTTPTHTSTDTTTTPVVPHSTGTATGTPGNGGSSATQSQTPGQGVADQPSVTGTGDRVGGDRRRGGDDGDSDTAGSGPGRTGAAGAPITVNLRRGAGGPGRCWYAIVHVGEERDDLERLTRRSLGGPCYVATLREPVDLGALTTILKGTPFADIGSGDKGLGVLSRLGIAVGEQLVTPESLVRLVRKAMFSDFEGRLQKVSGVVVTHDADKLEGDEGKVRDVLANGLLRGLREAEVPSTNGGVMPVPVVGVELTTTKPSWVPWYIARKISSVDNLDQRPGRTALSMLMSGAERGHYGTKDTAKSLLPKAGAEAAPVRFRTAGAVGTPAEASAGLGAATILMAALLALTSGWALGLAGRRTLRRRLAGSRR